MDSEEWTAMKYSMYEVIELYRATRGIRANVAIKILLLGIMAMKTDVVAHMHVIQRWDTFAEHWNQDKPLLTLDFRCIPYLTDMKMHYNEVSYKLQLSVDPTASTSHVVYHGGNAAFAKRSYQGRLKKWNINWTSPLLDNWVCTLSLVGRRWYHPTRFRGDVLHLFSLA